MANNTISKNKTAEIPTKSGKDYSYQYVDIAQIHEYLQENNISYYQYTERIEEDDYIMTVPIVDGKELAPRRGSRIVNANLIGNDNPAQKMGSALTYARRYSLLMAFGLATEDDDATALNKEKEITLEEAENYTFKSGKHEGWTLKEVVEEDQYFLEWLIGQGDPKMLKMIEIVTGEKLLSEKEQDERIELKGEFSTKLAESGQDLEELLKHYGAKTSNDLTNDQLKEAIEVMKRKVERNK